MDSDTTAWSLVLRFPDQSPRFCNGFEAGMLWQRLVSHEVDIVATIHSHNHALVHQMAVHYGYTIRAEPTEYDEWILVTLKLPGAEPVETERI